MKIRYKLTGAIVILFILVIAVNLALIFISEQKLTDKITENLFTINSLMVSEIEHSIKFRTEYWEVFAVLPLIRETVIDSNTQFDKIQNVSGLIVQRDKEWLSVPKEEITPFMKDILDNELSARLNARKEFYEKEYGYSIYPEAFITNKYGALIGATGKTTDYYQADEVWWQIAKEKGFYLGEVEYDDSSGTYSLVGAVRIDDEKSNFIGVIKFLLNTDEIVRNFQKMAAGEDVGLYSSTYFELINSKKEVIYKTGEAEYLIPLSVHEQEELAELEQNEGKALLVKSDIPGWTQELVVHEHFKHEGPLKYLNWILVLEFDRDKLLLPVEELKKGSIIYSLLILGIILLLTLFLSQSIYSSINKLHQAVEKIKKGDLSIKANIHTKDEIESLGKAFNLMTTQLSDQQKKIAEQEKRKVKQFKQINLSLDKKIKERTTELEHKKSEAEEAQKATLNLIEDIEEAQKKLKHSYEELKGLDKLKTDFLSFTSHELRTPLTPIRSQLQRMLSKDLPKLERKESLEMVLRNTIRLDKLINDVLDISRIESKRLKIFKKKTDLHNLILSVVKHMGDFAREKNIRIITSLNKCQKFASLDEDRIEQVLINLVDNAIKHSGTKEIIITGEKKDNKLELCVQDKGQGIPAAEIPHLFEAFHPGEKEKQMFKGAGLGLPISRGIVRAHGGNIWFKTKEGKGTIFCIDLPI